VRLSLLTLTALELTYQAPCTCCTKFSPWKAGPPGDATAGPSSSDTLDRLDRLSDEEDRLRLDGPADEEGSYEVGGEIRLVLCRFLSE